MSLSETPVKYADFVRRLFNTSKDDISKDFTHAILGVATEVRELRDAVDAVNALEERGDLRFYVVALAQVIGDGVGAYPYLDDIRRSAFETAQDLQTTDSDRDLEHDLDLRVNDLLDHAKRWVGYGKAPDNLLRVMHDVFVVEYLAPRLCPFVTEYIPDSKVEAVNMAKLLKRYPGGDFSAFHALQRDLEAERETLQAASVD